MDIQKMMGLMSSISRNTRSDYHLTIGDAIEKLESMPSTDPVAFDDGSFPGVPHSYRGYYADLALDWTDEKVTAGELLERLRAALDQEFTGYKGGVFLMGKDTPLWMADYGSCGRAIVGLSDDGTLATKDVD